MCARGVRLRNVACDCAHLRAAGAQGCRRFRQTFAAARANGQLAAFTGQRRSNASANAATGAGDERDVSV